jgi:Tol biopolymer transport system component
VALTANNTGNDGPCYSPSGKKIAYSGEEGTNGDLEIYTIKSGGGGRFNVTDNSRDDTEPSWGSSK